MSASPRTTSDHAPLLLMSGKVNEVIHPSFLILSFVVEGAKIAEKDGVLVGNRRCHKFFKLSCLGKTKALEEGSPTMAIFYMRNGSSELLIC